MLVRSHRSADPRSTEISLSSNQIWPAEGRSWRLMQRATVDFPEPELPTRARVCPVAISKSIPFTAKIFVLFRQITARRQYCLYRPQTRNAIDLCGSVNIFEAGNIMSGTGHQLFRKVTFANLHPVTATWLEAA